MSTELQEFAEIERMAIQDAANGDLNTELTGEARRIYIDARDDAVRARRRGVYPQFFEPAPALEEEKQ